MNVPQREMQRDEPALLHEIFRHGLLHIWQTLLQSGLHQLAHDLSGHSSGLELFRARINSCHSAGCGRCRIGIAGRNRIDFRMNHVDPPVECGRFAEKYELRPRLQLFVHPFDAFEKDCLHLSRAVGYPYAQPFFELYSRYLGSDLDICHVGSCIADPDIRTLVHISERIQPQQLADRSDREFLLQQGGSLRTHSRKKLNIHIQSVLCHTLANVAKNIRFCKKCYICKLFLNKSKKIWQGNS